MTTTANTKQRLQRIFQIYLNHIPQEIVKIIIKFIGIYPQNTILLGHHKIRIHSIFLSRDDLFFISCTEKKIIKWDNDSPNTMLQFSYIRGNTPSSQKDPDIKGYYHVYLKTNYNVSNIKSSNICLIF